MHRHLLLLALLCSLGLPLAAKSSGKSSVPKHSLVPAVPGPLALPHRAGVGTSPLQAPALRSFVTIIGNMRSATPNSPAAKANAISLFRQIYLSGTDEVHELMQSFTEQLYTLLRSKTMSPRYKDKQLIFLLEEYQYLLTDLLNSINRPESAKQVDQLTTSIYTAASPTLADYWHRGAKIAAAVIGGVTFVTLTVLVMTWIRQATQLHGLAPALASQTNRARWHQNAHLRHHIQKQLIATHHLTPDGIDISKVNIDKFLSAPHTTRDIQARTITGPVKMNGQEYMVTVPDVNRGISDFAGAMADDNSTWNKNMNTLLEALVHQPHQRKVAHLKAHGITDPEHFIKTCVYHDNHLSGEDMVNGQVVKRENVPRQPRGITDFLTALATPNSELLKFISAIRHPFEKATANDLAKMRLHGYESTTSFDHNDMVFLQEHPITKAPTHVLLSRTFNKDGKPLAPEHSKDDRMPIIEGPSLSTGLAFFGAAPEHSPAGRFALALAPLFENSYNKRQKILQRFGVMDGDDVVYLTGQNGETTERVVGLMPKDASDAEKNELLDKTPASIKGTDQTTGRQKILVPAADGIDKAIIHGMIYRDGPGGKIFWNLGNALEKGILTEGGVQEIITGVIKDNDHLFEGKLSKLDGRLGSIQDQIKELADRISGSMLGRAFMTSTPSRQAEQ